MDKYEDVEVLNCTKSSVWMDKSIQNYSAREDLIGE